MNIFEADKKYLVKTVTEAGSPVFEPATMRFFNSRLCKVFACDDTALADCRVFVTSEQCAGARKYTVRIFWDDGTVERGSEFQEYFTAREAYKHVAACFERMAI